MDVLPAVIEETFSALVDAALKGERCPKTRHDQVPDGRLNRDAITVLCRSGRIRIEIFAKNFRRVTILLGEHAGIATAGPPNPAWRPYKIITDKVTLDTAVSRRVQKFVERGELRGAR